MPIDQGEVPPLDVEHVEIIDEPLSLVEPPTCPRHPFDDPRQREVLFGECPALDEADEHDVVVWKSGDHRCTDSVLTGNGRIGVFVVPIDGQRNRRRVRDAQYVGPLCGRHLQVAVGEPTMELGHLTRSSSQHVEPVTQPIGEYRIPPSAQLVSHARILLAITRSAPGLAWPGQAWPSCLIAGGSLTLSR